MRARAITRFESEVVKERTEDKIKGRINKLVWVVLISAGVLLGRLRRQNLSGYPEVLGITINQPPELVGVTA